MKTIATIEIRVSGKSTVVPAADVLDRVVVIKKNDERIKVASLHDEELLEVEPVPDVPRFIKALKRSHLGADLLTFAGKFTDSEPRHPFFHEWDNFAVLPITSFAEWSEGLSKYVRRDLKRAERSGVVTRTVDFSDELVAQIKSIYDELPVRQGVPFYHYGKSLDVLKHESSTYLERSEFIGACSNEELIGFTKLTYAGDAALIIHILSKKAHADKWPTNVLVAKAVARCAEKGIRYLIYGKYRYTSNPKTHTGLMEFKRRNGFMEMRFPRYYVPVSLRGWIHLKLGKRDP